MSSQREGRTFSCTDNDLYHYTKMIDYFQNRINDPEQAEEWKYKALNRLMELLECTEDEKFVQNSLIVLMAMTGDLPADIYNSRGTHVARLSGVAAHQKRCAQFWVGNVHDGTPDATPLRLAFRRYRVF